MAESLGPWTPVERQLFASGGQITSSLGISVRALSQSGEGREKCQDDFSQACYWVGGGGEGHSLIYCKPNLEFRHIHAMLSWFSPYTQSGPSLSTRFSGSKGPFSYSLLISALCALPKVLILSTSAWRQMMEEGRELIPALAFTLRRTLDLVQPNQLNSVIKSGRNLREKQRKTRTVTWGQ